MYHCYLAAGLCCHFSPVFVSACNSLSLLLSLSAARIERVNHVGVFVFCMVSGWLWVRGFWVELQLDVPGTI